MIAYFIGVVVALTFLMYMDYKIGVKMTLFNTLLNLFVASASWFVPTIYIMGLIYEYFFKDDCEEL